MGDELKIGMTGFRHDWKGNQMVKAPKYIPIEQHEALMKIIQENSYDFAVKLMGDLAVLAVHEAYGFRAEHLKKFREALGAEIDRFADNVEWEFRAETDGMSYRQRQKAKPDLFYTMEKLDGRIRELIPDAEDFQSRYGGFGGRLSWAKTEEKS